MTVQQQRTRIAAELRRLAAQTTESPTPAALGACACAAPGHLARARAEPIAIIGLAGQFPGCASVRAFWRALDEDRRLIEPTPAGRLAGEISPALGAGWGGFIPNLRGFDPAFFGMLPGAADLVDPRQRLLLMAAYHSLEDAGCAPRSLRGQRVGVFVGIEEDEYFQTLRERGLEGQASMAGAASLAANQISYFLDLRGPSEVVNTMCSGGAVALNRAVMSLRAGESSLAIVGAANLLLRPEPFVGLEATGQLSRDGTVRSFGRDAAGFVRAEGVISLVLKPLTQAERDGDPIYALIRHSAVNFNGHGGMSMAAPDIAAHAALIAACYREAGVDPRRIDYVEAQGMGNRVADLAEWQAINRALRTLADERGVRLTPGQCRVSTLKPAIGHMHAVSALGALCKIIRSFQTDQLHPILGFTELAPDLTDPAQPCQPLAQATAWPREDQPRLAGLHSYGAGGNNAHLLIEEHRSEAAAGNAPPRPGDERLVFPFSAPSAAQRVAVVRQVLDAVKQHSDYSFLAIAKTLQTGRDALSHRVAFVAGTLAEWIEQAEAYLGGEIHAGVFEGEVHGEPVLATESSAEAEERAQAWVRGDPAHAWLPLAGARVHLPGCVFALQECWFERGEPAPITMTPSPAKSGASLAQPRAEAIVAELLCPYLRVAPAQLEWDRAFGESGFDSVLVARLAATLEQAHGVRIEPARFFEFKTPRRLAQAVAELLMPCDAAGRDKHPLPGRAVRTSAPAADEAIAIIGVAGRYPGAETLDELWASLEAGRECITEVPADRWDLSRHFEPDPDVAAKQGKSYGKWGGFIRGLHEFDSLFFKISPREAETMSPKERLVLQSVWHALEDAGQRPSALAGGAVGVFIGATRAGWDPYPGTFSSIPNRVSYFFDFRGPSVPIDTMCSSSLVAIHEACRHLQNGECELAIAGGVNLYLDPSHYAVLAHGRFLSPDGHCRAFGAGANGMVPGEGVGTMVLKPLARARADGDRIYGVIRSSATNHGGSANGFTVPNPEAQRDVIIQALARGAIDPRSISYVEAHGTGTVLGDPIEVRGLTEAYRRFTDDVGFCRLGSLKGNLGHLEAAAGIAGLTKVLLQFKHHRVTASLHAAEPNPNIDFATTPFVVPAASESWPTVMQEGRPLPRRAAVSSFGAGGSNAHLIVEEFVPAPREPVADEGPQIIVLSARTRGQLRAAAEQLRAFAAGGLDVSLGDLAFTLQMGREPMEERLALVAASFGELEQRLRQWLEKADAADAVWSGRVKTSSHGRFAALSADDWAPVWSGLVARCEHAKLAALWVEGAQPDWSLLHRERSSRRAGLPLHPFARDVLPVPNFAVDPTPDVVGLALHPLVHRNTSTLDRVRFTSVFTGREFFLADHLVQHRKMLPAAAYLELARAAFVEALPADEPANGQAVQLTDVLWPRPLCVEEEPYETHIGLARAADGTVRFEIYSGAAAASANRLVHAEGRIGFTTAGDRPMIDVAAIQGRTSRVRIDAERCYAVFAALGIAYGPAHRAIEALHVGAEEVLARLRWPETVVASRESFVLHPSLIDAALQATIGFALNDAGSGDDAATRIRPSLPYAIAEVEVLGSCTNTVWAVVRRHHGGVHTEKLQRFDVELCDERGTVAVRMRGFAARMLLDGDVRPAVETPQLLLRAPAWVPLALASKLDGKTATQRTVLFFRIPGDGGGAWEDRLRADGVSVETIALGGADLAHDFESATQQTARVLQRILAGKPKSDVVLQVLAPRVPAAWPCPGLAGLLRTANLEAPLIHGQLIEFDPAMPIERGLAELGGVAVSCADGWIRLGVGTLEVAVWKEIDSTATTRPWKDGGVYLITGGLGGLGRIFAEEIAMQARAARLVLVGRSAITESGARFLEHLRGQGASAEYHAVDLARGDEVNALVRDVASRHGGLHGVLHAAGIVRDQYLLKKSAEEIAAVLAPKVAGALNLDRATANLRLERFVLFSSGAVLGSAGQGDYAAANAFLDAFAHERRRQCEAGLRQGLTLAIDWPFWADGGMRMEAAALQQMAATTGLFALETRRGLEAFYRCCASGHSQVLVLNGLVERVRTWLPTAGVEPAELTLPATPTLPEKPALPAISTPTPGDSGDLEARLSEFLKQLVADTLKVRAEQLEMDKDLAAYGLDSILVLDLNNQLERTFPRLSKTLFFEYATLGELTRYFLEAHRGIVVTKFGQPTTHRESDVRAAGQPSVDRAIEAPQSTSAPPRAADTAPPLATATPAPKLPEQPITFDDLILRLGVEVVAPAADPLRQPDAPPSWPGWHAFFQSFAIFGNANPQFSFSRMATSSEAAPADVGAYLEGQVALRRLLFRGVDFRGVRRIVDLGCGHAADLIELAHAYPHLTASGLTIDPAEAAFAQRMMARRGLAGRVDVQCVDCTRHVFEPAADLVFSIQLMHFIADAERKRTLFRNVAAALSSGGVLLMAEFVCHLKKPMKDAVLHTTVHTALEWAEFLGSAGLQIAEVIDASDEIVNFLRDPELEANIAGVDDSRQQELRKYKRQIGGLEQRWVSYTLMRVVKADAPVPPADLIARNLERLDHRVPARVARAQLSTMPALAAYGDVIARFRDCVGPASVAADADGQLVHEDELEAKPALAALVRAIDAASPPIGYERLLYPFRFIVPSVPAYVRLIRDTENRLIVPLLPIAPAVYERLNAHVRRTGEQMLLVDTWHDWLARDDLRPVPLGVLQTLDLEAFTLAGTRMRKLRYLVNKFADGDGVRTEEWMPGAPVPRAELQRVMLAWGAAKKNVITSTIVCMEHLLAGELPPAHRVFFTYAGGKLCSAIVVARCGDGAYLMDQEFYDPATAPLGHMEYAIVELIERLKREQVRYFSLGVTWYPLGVDSHPKVDAETWLWVREQGGRATLLGRIFEQGKTNYQFKKKFGVEGELIFAFLPRSAPFAAVLHYWSAFYQHSLAIAQVAERLAAFGAGRSSAAPLFDSAEKRRIAWRAAASFEQIPYTAHPLDLMSDTWFGRDSEAVRQRVAQLSAGVVADPLERLREIFPFRHLILTAQGRTAEGLFYGAFPKTRRRILSAIPWTSTLASALGNGFDVTELPCADALVPESDELYRGGIDVVRLRECLALPSSDVALVGLEVLSNATGGHPVRLGHVREVAEVARERGVPLVLDASRIVRNAVLLRQHDRACAGRDVWTLVREIAAAADHVVMSLTKDFAIPHGGLIATNDDALAEQIRAAMKTEAASTNPKANADPLALIGATLGDREGIVRRIEEQLALTRSLHDRLLAAGVPILRQTYGHALVIDATRFCADGVSKPAREALLQELFVATGIRGGLHQAGRQRQTVLDRALRFAFPLGLGRQHEEASFTGLRKFFAAEMPAAHQAPEPPRVASGRDDISVQLSAAQRGALANFGPRVRPEPIAIVGLGGKFPGAADYHTFWEKIDRGENFIGPVPPERWNHRHHHDPALPKVFVPHKTRCGFGAFLDGHDRFDAAFFQLADSEVAMMDPQERLALEAAWSCIEDAGYVPENLSRDTGLFSGVTYNEYQKVIPRTTHSCFLTSRLAYHFNFRGPAMAVDTGCASSMAAIDTACRSLRDGACPTALVVGANVIMHPDHYASLSQELSSGDVPASKPFGEDDGWIPAEGVVAVLLKPLSAAQRDGDHIHAVIASSRMGQDGKTSWFCAPNPKAQAALITANFEQAGISPTTISYIEAAASGSPLGDAIELEGLTTAFAKDARPWRWPIGTVKSNVGHGEGVSTLLQLAKVLLQFRSEKLYPLIHRDGGNPNLRLDETPFRLLEQVEPWRRPEIALEDGRRVLPRRATISSFGGGGNMGHLILEEPPAREAAVDTGESCFVPLSAETPERLRDSVAALEKFLARLETLPLAWRETYRLSDVMATLGAGRRALACRIAFVASDRATLRALIGRHLRGETDPAILVSGERPVEAADCAELIRRGAWAELGRHWVNGVEVAWGDTFASRGARRVPMPTRQFAGRRFEISEAAFLRAIGAAAASGRGVPMGNVVAEGITAAGRRGHFESSTPTRPEVDAGSESVPDESARNRVVRAAFAKALGLRAEAVDFSVPLDRYGFDSAMVVSVAAELEKSFRRVPATLFFECETIRDVIAYLEKTEFDPSEAPPQTKELKDQGTKGPKDQGTWGLSENLTCSQPLWPLVADASSDNEKMLDDLIDAIFAERLSVDQILRKLNGTGHTNGGSHDSTTSYPR